MATKKKSRKKSASSKKSETRKAPARQLARKHRTSKKSAKIEAASKKAAGKKKAAAKKKASVKTTGGKSEIGIDRKSRSAPRQPGSSAFPRGPAGLQSGDLQGLSNVEDVDSESVDELLEEGNSFEAGIVSGVEDSREREGKEVRTREVPEDDVPGEYLDED
jgi:hypothetical protein